MTTPPRKAANTMMQQHRERAWSWNNPREVGWYHNSSGVSLGLAKKTGISFEVVRYGPREINTLLSSSCQPLEIVHEAHLTPGKTKQRFTYFRPQNPR